MTNTGIVNNFLAALHHKKMDVTLDMMTDDIFYHNIPLEPLRGKAAVKAFMEAGSDMEVLGLVTLHAAENGNIVMNERVDSFRLNGRVLDLPVSAAPVSAIIAQPDPVMFKLRRFTSGR